MRVFTVEKKKIVYIILFYFEYICIEKMLEVNISKR